VDDFTKGNVILASADEHDLRMREQVQPPSWPVRPCNGVYDLVAIVGGTAGLVASGGAALLGARSALLERA